MEGVEGMHPTQTIPAKELDGETIEATIRAIVLAKFALAVGGKVPRALEPDELAEECVSFSCPQ